MNLCQQFNCDLYWALQEIQKQRLDAKDDQRVSFFLRKANPDPTAVISPPKIPSPERQRELLSELEGLNVLKINNGSNTISSIYFLSVNEPTFTKMFREYDDYFHGRSNEITVIPSEEVNTPYCFLEGNLGYLQFVKHGQRTKIGKETTRHFKLLQCLLDPIGVYKTIESVFEKIQLPKDSNDQKIWDANTGKMAKITIIQNAIKELQKGKKLKGRIIFVFNGNKSQIKAELK
jgi:hypothetical protein